MTSSAITPTSQELPAWAVPATPTIEWSTVGINRDGQMYIYGETADKPGPQIPALLGLVTGANLSTHGQNSKYGARDYLDLTLASMVPGSGIRLRLPVGGVSEDWEQLPTPWSVRSLLGALGELDLRETAVKLQTKRGREATFFQVFPHDAAGNELDELRATPIGPTRDDLEIAINRLLSSLGQPVLFNEPQAHDIEPAA